ncbi:hypothetical protein I0J10_004786 [Salmonella enterica]|nr:hypothetical protein [Salmonella enterica]
MANAKKASMTTAEQTNETQAVAAIAPVAAVETTPVVVAPKKSPAERLEELTNKLINKVSLTVEELQEFATLPSKIQEINSKFEAKALELKEIIKEWGFKAHHLFDDVKQVSETAPKEKKERAKKVQKPALFEFHKPGSPVSGKYTEGQIFIENAVITIFEYFDTYEEFAKHQTSLGKEYFDKEENKAELKAIQDNYKKVRDYTIKEKARRAAAALQKKSK